MKWVRDRGKDLYHMARLSAGGAIEAANIAYQGEAAFALIRPPGHHASPDSAWGFCYFNNMGLAIKNLINKGRIKGAYILDFDLHTGDGNINSLKDEREIHIFNPGSYEREDYLREVKGNLEHAQNYDIIGVSAGFDAHVQDWGGILTTRDYRTLGEMVRDFSLKRCMGKRFSLLEGGYNSEVLGKNAAAFIKGFR